MRHWIICFNNWLFITFWELWHHKIIIGCRFTNRNFIKFASCFRSSNRDIIVIYWSFWLNHWFFNWNFCCLFDNLFLNHRCPFFRILWKLKFFPPTNLLLIKRVGIFTPDWFFIETHFILTDWLINFVWILILLLFFGLFCSTFISLLLCLFLFIILFFHPL